MIVEGVLYPYWMASSGHHVSVHNQYNSSPPRHIFISPHKWKSPEANSRLWGGWFMIYKHIILNVAFVKLSLSGVLSCIWMTFFDSSSDLYYRIARFAPLRNIVLCINFYTVSNYLQESFHMDPKRHFSHLPKWQPVSWIFDGPTKYLLWIRRHLHLI
jgi:hypothetical protein